MIPKKMVRALLWKHRIEVAMSPDECWTFACSLLFLTFFRTFQLSRAPER